ncbi:taurine dioxygenase, 2-oxoglutarate-dependent [Alcanivorax balearicus MACL04]|uniref:Taurine dioxygenase, 2-oxoglutarate-dependent n=1 Tax=Alloalcanivorax balearicus MACL04 TaxID=1177182 RepID=A0ABT2R485_9GAMM|nr:TauD/TfdA family dioxygenase [Alloalcanivorax balearicus]MCU5784591.1 taurine dioxygenase, 2-oxoglutarate-dependent [Alloalcanivorax balearicus MACL04]
MSLSTAAPDITTGEHASEQEHLPFRIKPLSPTIGVEIEGIDLRQSLDEDTYKAMRTALIRHKLLVFRDQDITPAQHVRLAARFGELEVHPVFKHHPDHPELVLLGGDQKVKARENIFHTDVSWRECPSMGSMLRCIECPEVGGDTLWVNMAAAYANLPEDVKERLAGLYAVHDVMPAFGARMTPQECEVNRHKFPPAMHPVVRTHPESGEKILYVNEAFVTHLANYNQVAEVRMGFDFRLGEMDLLQYLYRQAATPEYQVRLRWRPNTIAFWDNRSTQHYAIQDYFPAVRRMMRATIIGDRPR